MKDLAQLSLYQTRRLKRFGDHTLSMTSPEPFDTDRTSHVFGRRITQRYRGRLETVLDQRHEGYPTLRTCYQTSFVQQYEKGNRLLRTETCLNDTHRVAIGRHLENLPALKERLTATQCQMPGSAS